MTEPQESTTGKANPKLNTLDDHTEAYHVDRPDIPPPKKKAEAKSGSSKGVNDKVVYESPPKPVPMPDPTLREAAPSSEVQLLEVNDLLSWAKTQTEKAQRRSKRTVTPRLAPQRPGTTDSTLSRRHPPRKHQAETKKTEHLSPSPRRQFQGVGTCTLRNGLVARHNNMCDECLALEGTETEPEDSSARKPQDGSEEEDTPPAKDAAAEAGWRCTQCRVPSKPECRCQRCDACHELSWFCSCVTCFQCKKPFPNRLQYDEDTSTTRGRTTAAVDVAEGAAQRRAAPKLPPPQSHPAPKGTPYCKGINRGFKFNAVGRPTLNPNRVLEWQVPEAHTVVPGGWKRRKIPPQDSTAVGKEGDAGPCRVVAGKLYTFESHASRGHFLSVPSARAGAPAMLLGKESVWLAQAAGAGGAFHFIAVASPPTQSEPLDAPCLVSKGMDLLTLLQPKDGDTQLGTWTLRYVEPEAEESEEGQDPVLEGEQQPVAKTECVKLTVDTGKGQAALDVGPSPSPGSAFSVSALDVTSPPVSQLFIVQEAQVVEDPLAKERDEVERSETASRQSEVVRVEFEEFEAIYQNHQSASRLVQDAESKKRRDDEAAAAAEKRRQEDAKAEADKKRKQSQAAEEKRRKADAIRERKEAKAKAAAEEEKEKQAKADVLKKKRDAEAAERKQKAEEARKAKDEEAAEEKRKQDARAEAAARKKQEAAAKKKQEADERARKKQAEEDAAMAEAERKRKEAEAEAARKRFRGVIQAVMIQTAERRRQKRAQAKREQEEQDALAQSAKEEQESEILNLRLDEHEGRDEIEEEQLGAAADLIQQEHDAIQKVYAVLRAKEARAAIKIQAMQRGRMDRQRVARWKEEEVDAKKKAEAERVLEEERKRALATGNLAAVREARIKQLRQDKEREENNGAPTDPEDKEAVQEDELEELCKRWVTELTNHYLHLHDLGSAATDEDKREYAGRRLMFSMELSNFKRLNPELASSMRSASPRASVSHRRRSSIGRLRRTHSEVIRYERMTNLFRPFIEILVRDTDKNRANVTLMNTLFNDLRDRVDYSDIVGSQDLYFDACVDGSASYLDIFLSLSGTVVAKDMAKSIIETSLTHEQCIPLLKSVLKHGPTLHLEDNAAEMQEAWQEAFEKIASKNRLANSNSGVLVGNSAAMADRIQVLQAMGEEEAIQIDFSAASEQDDLTILHRACEEGDAQVVSLLLRHFPDEQYEVIGEPSDFDRLTPLMYAVLSNSTLCVQSILDAFPDDDDLIGLNFINEVYGNAVDIAGAEMKNKKMVKLLAARGLKSVKALLDTYSDDEDNEEDYEMNYDDGYGGYGGELDATVNNMTVDNLSFGNNYSFGDNTEFKNYRVGDRFGYETPKDLDLGY